jgi:hypothetical protein
MEYWKSKTSCLWDKQSIETIGIMVFFRWLHDDCPSSVPG